MRLLPLLLALFFVSCATSSHVMKPIKSEYAPLNYQARGVVKYLNQGADFVIEDRRKHAFKTMYEICGGQYKIVSESAQTQSAGAMQVTNTFWSSLNSNYWYIGYECLPGSRL